MSARQEDRRPLIGVTVGGSHDRFGRPRLVIPRAYVTALQAAGAGVVLLPPGQGAVLLDHLDGILFPGGGPDVEPRHYGAAASDAMGETDADLDALELPMARAAVERGTPVLGICRGHQVVNVALGGTLYQDIRQDGLSEADHTTPPELGRDLLAHAVNVEEGSDLRRLVGAARLPVNSRHHQAVRGVAPGLRVTATSDDGVIEALESADGSILTIQCHPENLTTHAWARALFEGFVARGRDVR